MKKIFPGICIVVFILVIVFVIAFIWYENESYANQDLISLKANIIKNPITLEEAEKLLGKPPVKIPKSLNKMQLLNNTLYLGTVESCPCQVVQLWCQNKNSLEYIVIRQRQTTPQFRELPRDYPIIVKLNNGALANVWAHTRVAGSEYRVQEMLKEGIFVMAEYNIVFQQEPAGVHTLWHAQWIEDEIIYSVTAANMNKDKFLDLINLI